MGSKWADKYVDIYAIERPRGLHAELADAGVAPGDVDRVVLTHLHFDHCGWNTRKGESGELVPTFPNARYWMSRGEVEHARSPNLRDRASYDARNWEPLFDAGVVELFDGSCEPVPGVEGYDLYPMQTLANKQEWIPRAAEAGWWSIFEHETEAPIRRLVEEKPGRFRAVEPETARHLRTTSQG